MSTLSRFTGTPGHDNTSRVLNNDIQSPAYASTLAITTTKSSTLVNVGLLTGAMLVTVGTGSGLADDAAPFVGDTVEFLFAADGAGAHIVTFSTGFVSPGTLTVAANKYGAAKFRFNGTVWVGSSSATA